MKILLFIYIRLIRPITSRIIYFFWKRQAKKNIGYIPFDLNIKGFEDYLRNFEYKPDPAGGAIDFSIRDPEDFLRDSPYGRDCDDFALMWYWWAKENAEQAFLLYVVPDNNVREAHAIAVGKYDGRWYLLDYKAFLAISFEQAVSFEHRYRYPEADKLHFIVGKSNTKGWLKEFFHARTWEAD